MFFTTSCANIMKFSQHSLRKYELMCFFSTPTGCYLQNWVSQFRSSCGKKPSKVIPQINQIQLVYQLQNVMLIVVSVLWKIRLLDPYNSCITRLPHRLNQGVI